MLSDAYSLGVILYELLAGRMPYAVAGPIDRVVARIRTMPPAPLREGRGSPVEADLETIVLKCLAKEPDRRYQDAGALAADLGRYLDGGAIDARRDSRWYVLRKTAARHRFSTLPRTPSGRPGNRTR